MSSKSPSCEFKFSVSDPTVDLGGKRTQQDCGIEYCTDTWCMVGVFDGHGKDGFSNAAAAAAKMFISEEGFYERLVETPESTANHLFDTMQTANFDFVISKLEKKNVEFKIKNGFIDVMNLGHLRGGTTATLVFVDNTGLLTTLNVGDSDAWMYSKTSAVKLIANHYPENPAEYDRLMLIEGTQCVYDNPQLNCTVVPLSTTSVHGQEPLTPFYVCSVDNKPATLVRFTNKGRVHTIAMTRSIGDENLREGGVISTPSISQHQLTGDVVIKVASDGYWDAIKSADELLATNDALGRFGYAANELVSDWFVTTKEESEKLFGCVGDNMWGYVVTVQQGTV